MNAKQLLNTYLMTLFILLFSCNLPEDPANTFENVHNKILKVGYSESEPWVITSGKSPEGIEPQIVQQLAKELNAKIIWVKNSESELIKMLQEHKLHLVVSGLKDDSPWKDQISFTLPYYISPGNQKYVFAVPQGENKWLTFIEKFFNRNKQKIYLYVRESAE
jgi:ABC-type amino acid transport substrate-binding protein